MAADEDPKDIAATDKAYQAAVDSAPMKPAPTAKGKAKGPAPVKAAEEAAKPEMAAAPAKAAIPAVEPKPEAKVAAKTPAKPLPAKKVPVKKSLPVEKVAKAEPAPTPLPAKVVGPKAKKPVAVSAAPRIAAPQPKKVSTQPTFAGLFTNFMLKETTMDMSPDFSKFQETMTEAQAKAKAAFEKGTSMLGEASDFAKGNVEAVMESGKIFADGMRSFGSEVVSEGRTAFEAMSSDIKELAAAKSPTDFFKLQGDLMRKNFDSAVAYSSKNSESMLKLMSDAMAPISGRVSMAMDKVRSVSV